MSLPGARPVFLYVCSTHHALWRERLPRLPWTLLRNWADKNVNIGITQSTSPNLTSWWPNTALFKNAVTTSSALIVPLPISVTSAVADISVITSSRSFNNPLCRGKSITLFCEAGGSLSTGRSHCFGIELFKISLPLWAWISQLRVILMSDLRWNMAGFGGWTEIYKKEGRETQGSPSSYVFPAPYLCDLQSTWLSRNRNLLSIGVDGRPIRRVENYAALIG